MGFLFWLLRVVLFLGMVFAFMTLFEYGPHSFRDSARREALSLLADLGITPPRP